MKEEERESTKHVFKICMEGKWEEVVEIYKKNRSAHKAIITRTGDTALHVAVTDGQEHVVCRLVEQLKHHRSEEEALRIQNRRKNTVLHLAASMGSVKMIEEIANADPSLLSVRNLDGETPLFLAAFHGRTEEFFAIHNICQNVASPRTNPIDYCGRNDGDTILHCAIAADNFDLAFRIIHLYEGLVNKVNEKGDTPLHVLASKPSAFRSGSRLGRIEAFIYHGILVKELKADTYNSKQPSSDNAKSKIRFPDNYQTCLDFMTMMKKGASIVTNRFPFTNYVLKKLARKGDPEAPHNIAFANNNGIETNSEATAWSHPLYPENYKSCCDFLKFLFVVVLIIFGKGTNMFKKLHRKKEKHVWAEQVMNELIGRASMYVNDDNGSKPQLESSRDKASQDQETSPYCVYDGSTHILDCITEEPSTTKGDTNEPSKGDKKKDEKSKRDNENKKERESPMLIAAKNGVTEIVERILELFPVAIHDMDANKKNIVLLAVENRQPDLYELLLKKKPLKESLFRKVDNEANSALHLAAKLGGYKPWLIPGAALQMYWEMKWYYFVKESMPPRFFGRYNKECKTPREVFTETHKDLIKTGGDWLKQISESCSLVAALVATVAFAASTTVPGGVKEQTGAPTLENTTAFKIFAISSLMALSCSVTAVVLFLSILTSRYQEQDFGKNLPRKLILGLTSLFMSITTMLVSFCAGHFLVLRNKLKDVALPIYAATCLPVTLFALAQFPLYIDLIWATFQKVPRRSYKPGTRI